MRLRVDSSLTSEFALWLPAYLKSLCQLPGFLGAKVLESEVAERPAVVFVLGGPGAGKGTQCAKIVEASLTRVLHTSLTRFTQVSHASYTSLIRVSHNPLCADASSNACFSPICQSAIRFLFFCRSLATSTSLRVTYSVLRELLGQRRGS